MPYWYFAGAVVVTACGLSGWHYLTATALTFLGCYLDGRLERTWLGIR